MFNKEIVKIVLDKNKVIEIQSYKKESVVKKNPPFDEPIKVLNHCIQTMSEGYLAWQDISIEPYCIDTKKWPELIKHSLEILHLSCLQHCDETISDYGFVDFESPFILPGPIDKRFSSWLLSPMCGIGDVRIFKAIGFNAKLKSFPLALFDFGRRSLDWGVCTYSDPRILNHNRPLKNIIQNLKLNKNYDPSLSSDLISISYKKRWLFFWFIAMCLFKKKAPVYSFFRSLTLRKSKNKIDIRILSALKEEIKRDVKLEDIDVVIPTLNRPLDAKKILDDLTCQTLQPKKVIVVEQILAKNRKKLSDYLSSISYPFKLDYVPVSWQGACKARNEGLKRVESGWVIFIDDDIRIHDKKTLQCLLETAKNYFVDAICSACGDVEVNSQSGIYERLMNPRIHKNFAGGFSLINISNNQNIKYDLRLDGGYGEDYNFGLSLRLAGVNVLYSYEKIPEHLKRQEGGFRDPYPHPWSQEVLQPKPSPTVMLSRMNYATKNMQNGYKLFYWLMLLKRIPLYKMFFILKYRIMQWKASVKWANYLSTIPKC